MATTPTSSMAPERVYWRAVWALAILNAANLFGFMAYQQSQARVLQQFNYQNIAILLIIAQGIIGVIVNPVMGYLADKNRYQADKSFNLIGLGVNFAGLIFVLVALGATGVAADILRPIVPVLVVLWLLAMAMFNSPALALLQSFAPPNKVAQANSIIALITLILGAAEPYIGELVDILPLTAVFLAGGAVLVVAYHFLRISTPQIEEPEDKSPTPQLSVQLILVFLVGVVVMLISKLPLEAVPALLGNQLVFIDETWMVLLAMGLSSALAIPLGNYLKQITGWHIVLTIILALVAAFLPFCGSHWTIGILGLLLFSLVSALIEVCALPFALGRVKPLQAGIGTGFYSSGAALGVLLATLILLPYDEHAELFWATIFG